MFGASGDARIVELRSIARFRRADPAAGDSRPVRFLWQKNQACAGASLAYGDSPLRKRYNGTGGHVACARRASDTGRFSGLRRSPGGHTESIRPWTGVHKLSRRQPLRKTMASPWRVHGKSHGGYGLAMDSVAFRSMKKKIPSDGAERVARIDSLMRILLRNRVQNNRARRGSGRTGRVPGLRRGPAGNWTPAGSRRSRRLPGCIGSSSCAFSLARDYPFASSMSIVPTIVLPAGVLFVFSAR
jgi:hypothetical protein